MLRMRRSFKIIILSIFALNVLWACQYLKFSVKVKPIRSVDYPSKTLTYVSKNFTKLPLVNSTVTSRKPIVTTTKKPSESQTCSSPTNLVGFLRIDFTEIQQTYDSLIEKYEKLGEKPRTVFEPAHCKPKLSVAIIVPYRDREEHLKYLLGHLHPILSRQLIRYQIFVVEQNGNFTFNKGRLMNTGFNYIRGSYLAKFDCFIFHDVDMLPENDFILYECFKGVNAVQHLSCSLNKFNYRPLCCGMTVGGVLSFTESQFIKVNGFSNEYWGWGGEDDDMNARLKKKRLAVWRPKKTLCKYFMISHERDQLNAYHPDVVNARVKDASSKAEGSGLNTLHTEVTNVTAHFLYFHVFVDVGKPSIH